MNKTTEKRKQMERRWKQSAFGGIVVAIVYSTLSGASVVASIVMGVVFFVVAGVVMTLTEKRREAEAVPTQADAGPTPTKAVSAPTEAVSGEVTPATAAEPTPAPVDAAEPKDDQSASEAPASLIKPSTRLPGQEDLATRKGEWTYKPASGSA